jgi:hypothetical protein
LGHLRDGGRHRYGKTWQNMAKQKEVWQNKQQTCLAALLDK